MKLHSKSYSDMENIPLKYCKESEHGGLNISPHFSWENIPKGTKSLVLSFVKEKTFSLNDIHWLVINIPKDIKSLNEGISKTDEMPKCKELINTFGSEGYYGPRLKKGIGKENYIATIYALDVENIELEEDSSEAQLLREIKPNIIGESTLRGLLEI
jgi:Raf kinase inhibitor-like YbhB/YbcL family protein